MTVKHSIVCVFLTFNFTALKFQFRINRFFTLHKVIFQKNVDMLSSCIKVASLRFHTESGHEVKVKFLITDSTMITNCIVKV